MQRFSHKFARAISLALALALILAAAASAESVTAMVTAKAMKVYGDPDLFAQVGALGQMTIISAEAVSASVAKVTLGGRTGYARLSDLAAISSISTGVTVTADTRFYRYASTNSANIALAKGAAVNLLGVRSGWAMIETGGKLGFVYAGHLSNGGTTMPESPDTGDTGTGGVTAGGFYAAVTADSLIAYAKASTGSRKLGYLVKGCIVAVGAYNDAWAYVKYQGRVGFVARSGLTKVNASVAAAASEETTAASAASTETTAASGAVETVASVETDSAAAETVAYSNMSAYLNNASDSNEKKIYAFLTGCIGLNSAAACGILSNMYYESLFKPEIWNSSGISLGICQWTYGRLTRLKNFCSEHGYSYTSLEGQLWYLKYELENHYTKTFAYMKGVENTADGAYDAGYYWCYNFEVPANRATVSVKRGNKAKDTYWPKYN